MKRKSRLTIIAVIVFSLVIPIGFGGAPAASAAAKPARAKLPELVELHKWDNTLEFSWIRIPKRATSVQIYLRTTGKYVRTVKKNTYRYKKYRKNKNYILVKKGKRSYRVYKAGKWRKFVKTSEKYYEGNENPLKYDRIYQLRVRGVKGKKTGKASKILQFRTLSKKAVSKAHDKYSAEKQKAEDYVAYCEEHLNDPDGEDNWDSVDERYIPREESLWFAKDDSAYVDYEYKLRLFVSYDILFNQHSPEEGNYFYYKEGVGKVI